MSSEVALGCCYNLCWYVLALVMFSLVSNWSIELDSYTTAPQDYLQQVSKDWSIVPFTNITIIEGNGCKGDQEPVFQREWYGQMAACDCLGIWDYDITTDNEMVLQGICDYNQTRAGCT